MAFVSPELSLDLRPTNYNFSETVHVLLKQVSKIEDFRDQFEKVDEFLRKLEDEMKKIQVFQRELPLSMLLLKDAILVLNQESRRCKMENARKPVLEEFIPLKKECFGEENQISSDESKKDEGEDSSRDNKKNWMSSVQLWNVDNVTTKVVDNTKDQKSEDKRKIVVGDDDLCDSEKHREGKGLVPLIHRYPNPSFTDFRRKIGKEDVRLTDLSMLIPDIKPPKDDSFSCGLNSKFGVSRTSSSISPASSNAQTLVRPGNQQPTCRKQRRCWSPELHRRFIDALSKLDGPQVATPKQIRELMRVDGLTNDEVKSHLQKYRLHSRRTTTTNTSATSSKEKSNEYATSWVTQDQINEKLGNSQSGSPQGPLHFSSMEEDDDAKSEIYSWKGQVDRPGKDDVVV